MKSFIEFILENDDDHEEKAEHEFRSKLRQMHPDGVHVFHETPGHEAASIKREGLHGNGYGVFGTVGQNSNFVTSKKKTITHFVIPHSHAKYITHDMRYDGYGHLMHEHPDVKGADIATNIDKIPTSWIKSVKEVE